MPGTDADLPPRQRRVPRAETRKRLIDAAAAVFAEHGYDAASLELVAAAAGYSKGAVYSNFSGKEELFLALMRDRIQERVDAVQRATSAPGTVAEQAARAGSELQGLLRSQPSWHLLFIEFWTRAVRDPELREELVAQRRPMRELIARFLEGLSEDFDTPLPAPADDLAVIVLALSNGLAIEHLADPETVDAGLYGTALQLVLGGFAR